MLNERDILADAIKDERFMNVNLAFCAVESSPQLKPTLLDLMREEQDLHTRLFQFAMVRGWYPTLWGDLGFQQAGAFAGQQAGAFAGQPAGAFGAQPPAAQGYGAAAPANWALTQPATFARPQPGQTAFGWQQPAGATAGPQPGWQQPQPYNTGMAAAGQYRAGAQPSPAFGQYGTRQAAGEIEIAGREYGPY